MKDVTDKELFEQWKRVMEGEAERREEWKKKKKYDSDYNQFPM